MGICSFRIVGIYKDSVGRIYEHYVDGARRDQGLSELNVLEIDEFSVEGIMSM